MQLNRDTLSIFSGESIKRAKSRIKFPKQPPTYVVAFALKETYDDLVTAQQMICNKRSPQPSTNSITPTNSLKLLDSSHTLKLEQAPDAPESNDGNIEAIEETNPGAVESISSESNLEDADHSKIITFIETDATSGSSDGEKTENVEKFDEPEIIFNATNYTQRSKNSKFINRKPKAHKTVAPKCNKFKCKVPKNSINNRLQKYYERVKRNSNNSDRLCDRFSNISIVVPRARVLKNSLAKENLLDETMYNDPINLTIENDDGSQASYPSTAKNDSFISNSSGKTLTYVPSRTSSKNEDLNSIRTVKSATDISPSATPPYKSDVTVALAYKNSKNLSSGEKINNNEKFMHLASLTSQFEPLTKELGQLTSEFESMDRMKSGSSKEKIVHTKDISNVTLVNKRSNFDESSEDLFDMARTSSDFDENNSATCTLQKYPKYDSSNEKKEFEDNENPNKTQQSILETVISLGYYPDTTPSTSSRVAVTVVNQKDGFTTDTSQQFHVCSKNMGDHRKETIINTNIFTKQYNERDTSTKKKTINLPNHDEIKEMLIDDMQQMKLPEQSKIPHNISEMWDKLILVLDVAFKRLETTVTDKIIKELKTSIASLEFFAPSSPEVNIDLDKVDVEVIEPEQPEVISTQELKERDRSLQCSLVRSEVIDKIMQTRSTQESKKAKLGPSVNSLQTLKIKLIKNYLEVLKPPIVVGPEVMEDKGDTVTISTARTDTFDRTHRWKMLFFCPVRFVRENLFVIASVPAFFVVFLFVYGILVLLIQPW